MSSAESKIVIVGITGASGAVLGQTALSLLAADPRVARIDLVVTDAGRTLLEQELGIACAAGGAARARLLAKSGDSLARLAKKIEVLPNADVGASIASGSYGADAMCAIPLDGDAFGGGHGSQQRPAVTRGRRDAERGPATHSVRARHAAQPDSPGEHAARNRQGR